MNWHFVEDCEIGCINNLKCNFLPLRDLYAAVSFMGLNCDSELQYAAYHKDNRPFSYSAKEAGSSVIFIHFYTRDSIEWR